MKVQALHSALRILLLMAGLVVGQLRRLRMIPDHGVQLVLPTTHENLDFTFGFLGLGIELGNPRVFQFGTNVGKQGHPMFTRPIMGIRIEDNANFVLAFFLQLVNSGVAQCTHQTLTGFGMQIKVNGDCPQELVVLKELLVFLFQGLDVQTGQPLLPIDQPRIRGLGFLHEMAHNAGCVPRTALLVEPFLKLFPHGFPRAFRDRNLLRMLLVVDLPKAIHILVFELHRLF
jgi:hypothetical protein